MAQRCGFCGKTEKQHKGIACFDMEGAITALKLIKKPHSASEAPPPHRPSQSQSTPIVLKEP